jgi:hypothetical protein
MWTDTFINGVAPTATQLANWNNFRAQLVPSSCYSKMIIKGTYDTAGQVCTDPTIIAAYANALNTLTSYTSPMTNGNVWSLCASRYSGEVWLNPPSQCSGSNCPGPNGYIIRPGISNLNWGGVNTNTCNAPSQRQYFIFETTTASNSSSTINPTACDTFVSPSGKKFTVSNTYIDTIPNMSCGDSVITINLTVNNSTSSYIAPVVCDSTYISPSGKVWTNSGNYTDTISNAIGCDSIITITLLISPKPTVSMNSFTNDTVCVQSGPIPIPSGNPSGGSYSGPGVSGNNFAPGTAGVGNHYIIYTYTDNNNCSNSDSTLITVAGCVGINEFEGNNISIYPNPTNDLFTIDMGSYDEAVNYTIISIDGRIVTQKSNVTDNKITIDLGNESKGVYLLKLHNHKSSSVFRITRL